MKTSIGRSRDIVVFTLHKSASMYIHRQCEMLCKLGGLEYHSPNVPGSRLDARTLLTNKDVWRTRRGCFAPIRFFVDIPDVGDYQVILHLRDPRDVLVSMFYSYCYIHPGEIAANTGYRREAALNGIDAFVLAKASNGSSTYRGDYGTGGHVEDLIGNLPRRYGDYIKYLVGKPNVTLLKYEDMVSNYRGWLETFVMAFPLDHPQAIVSRLATQAPLLFPTRESDVMSHVRHVTPGDFKNKLEPATIRKLDEIFGTTLDALGYSRYAI